MLAGGERFGTGAHEAEASGQHQPLLRPGDREVDLPLVHLEVDCGDRAHAVHVQERRVSGAVQRPPHGGDVARHPGRGLVVDDEHALHLMRRVGGENLLDALDRCALAPFHVDDVHAQSVPLGEIDPQMAELPVARGEDAVSR